MENEKLFYEKLSAKVIANMAKRNMEGYYVATKEEATNLACSFIKEGEQVTWGGSMTINEIGLIDALKAKGTYDLLDRSAVAPEEVPNLYRAAFSADTFLMSSNAITVDGKLVNVDGTGNRVAALIYGPKQVIVIAGMNKVVKDEAAAIERVHQIAAPINAIRLDRQTPCGITGVCQDCLSPDCICMHTVITRNSRDAGRIKVILVGEKLGY